MPGVVLYVRISIIISTTSMLGVVAVRLPLEPVYLHHSASNSNSGQALLMLRIDIHILLSQVVYLVSHESSGPGGRRKQEIA